MESVVERPDTYHVEHPSDEHVLVEPFVQLTSSNAGPSSLILLNTDLRHIDVPRLWLTSSLHICADGGANRLYDYFSDPDIRHQYIPDFIVGDLDSLRVDVRSYYSSVGTSILPQYSQYSTDFMKAVKIAVLANSDLHHLLKGKIAEEDGLSDLANSAKDFSPFSMYVLGGIGGRFDQLFHSINHLYCMHTEYPHVTTFLVTDSDIIFLAPKGKTFIGYPDRKWLNEEDPQPKCGILPIGHPAILTTQGLKYDVANWPTSVGGNVSTSNAVVGDTGFEILSTDTVVVSIEITHHHRL